MINRGASNFSGSDIQHTTSAIDYTAWDFEPNDSDWHNTHKILNSAWVSELLHNYDDDFEFPNLQHFVLCTSDYVTEVLSEEEPLIQQCTDPHLKPPTREKSEYELVIPEPTLFYAPIDEANFYETLKNLPEVAHVTCYPAGGFFAPIKLPSHSITAGERTPNEIVLSLSCEYLSNTSLRSLIGILARYDLPMVTLANQCGQHNSDWFGDARNYWHNAVFGQKAEER